MLDGEELPGSPVAALDFVCYHEDVVFITNFTNFGKVLWEVSSASMEDGT